MVATRTLQQLTTVTAPVQDTDVLPIARGAGLLQSVSALAFKTYVGAVTLPVSIANGGTGATSAANARTNLGLGTMALVNSPAPVANGGTGGTTQALAQVGLGFSELLISTGTFTASGGPTFALAGYNRYRLELIGVIPSVTAGLVMQFSFDNGASYKAGAADYGYSHFGSVSGGVTNDSVDATTSLHITDTSSPSPGIIATASKANSFMIDIMGPKAVGFGVAASWTSNYINGASHILALCGSGQIIPGYGTPTNVRLLPSAGTISGAYALYGRTGF